MIAKIRLKLTNTGESRLLYLANLLSNKQIVKLITKIQIGYWKRQAKLNGCAEELKRTEQQKNKHSSNIRRMKNIQML